MVERVLDQDEPSTCAEMGSHALHQRRMCGIQKPREIGPAPAGGHHEPNLECLSHSTYRMKRTLIDLAALDG